MNDDFEVRSIRSCVTLTAIILTVTAIIIALTVTSCTLSFQNIDTHGAATDLVDDVQSTTPTVTPTLTIPLTK